MTLWEFRLRCGDGTVVDQTLVAEGTGEAEAAASAGSLIADRTDVMLSRPGVAPPPDVEARWREGLEGAFPAVVSDAGRLARYARGLEPQT